MRYEDDKYLDNEDDNDIWDDELDINSDDSPSEGDYVPNQNYSSDDYYDPYTSENSDAGHSDEEYDSTKEQSTEGENEDYYSEPEPEQQDTAKPKREGLFKRKVRDEDEDNDFFNSDDEPVVVKKPKAPKLDPEDPDYWIEEESPLTSIIPTTSNKWKWWLGGVVTILILLLFSWIWFLRPYTDNAVKYGYIKNMERRGSIIKTFEGTMIPYKELGDPDPLYFNEVGFSVESDSLAAVMKRMMLGCVPVRVEYEMYHTALPWKGEEKMIIIKADTADPRKILPPEYR